MVEPITITVGRQDTERLTLTVRGRERPSDEDHWDGNWLVVDTDVRAGGFIGCATALLRADELRRFRDELASAYDAVHGVASLESIEHWLSLTVTCEMSGKVTVNGEFTDRPGMGNTLHFWLPDMDQTFLPALIDQLDACDHAYPAKGPPKGP
jgi:hypothetical protein